MSNVYDGKKQLTAEQEGTLGMIFCELPPGPLELYSVREGTWAEEQGLKAGDVVLAVNGSSPIDMSRSDFMDIMLQRPLVLTLDIDIVGEQKPKTRDDVIQGQAFSLEQLLQDQAARLEQVLQGGTSRLEKVLQDQAARLEQVAAMDTPAATETSDAGRVEEFKAAEDSLSIGMRLRVKLTGRSGRLLIDDGSELPYKVAFIDGAAPFADWFKKSDVEVVRQVTGIVKYPSEKVLKPAIWEIPREALLRTEEEPEQEPEQEHNASVADAVKNLQEHIATLATRGCGRRNTWPAMDTTSDTHAPAVSRCHDINTEDCSTPRFQIGDIIELVGASVEPRLKGLSAVVTNVYDMHLAAIAVNECGRGVGECWPNYTDVRLVDKSWRIGGQVLVNGLQSKKREAMNGSIGKIVKHPREGHPCFIAKNGEDSPLLTLCVRLGHSWEGAKTVLIEPKYLTPIQLSNKHGQADAPSLNLAALGA